MNRLRLIARGLLHFRATHFSVVWGIAVGAYEAALASSLEFSQPEIFWDPLDRAAVLGQLGHTERERDGDLRRGRARGATQDVAATVH